MASACAKCFKPLEVEVERYDDEDSAEDASMTDDTPQTVPDDVTLSCGDHLHWECLIEAYEVSKCPVCTRDITTSPAAASSSSANSNPQILVDLNNEGGLQHQIDIFPLLQEESYLRAYPEDRKCRAFLEFCREGDFHAIADLLKSCDESAEEDEEDMIPEAAGPSKPVEDILRYQDPIGDMQSGLHAAAASGHREVAWLLLLLASEYSEMEFPALVFQEAASLGLMREEQSGKVDIRSLRDAHERSAEDVARENGVIWNGWIGNNRLTI
ncbi:unnamed protein product [Zymoseptoria tritici ST99CH_3D1]|uniref:RING-type domain-containing protein n=1 Tax=Zymoseptoria tritici (strain ST99CH_3D7) TaxID=1276538 RepID=A0A1X7RXB9_ZYMT9|nr:unnamed protein product [Zymoseptoria tritici ST99CH_3D7]SMR56359.1 unnamed protein product [Zymoseptoria tritici ST99CH_3D1]